MRHFFFVVALSVWSYSAVALAADPEGSKIKCSQLGSKFAAEFKKEYVNEVSLWGNPEFHYSSALATCLAYTEIVDGEAHKDVKDVWYYRRITDIYTNKVLAYSRYFVGKDDPTKKPFLVDLKNVGDAANLLPQDFAAAKDKLFSQ